MAIHKEQERKMGAGQAKTINAGAIGMVFDILQKSQYNFPVPSTIREIASNAVDSINEKKMARDILKGKAKAEDYFSRIEDVVVNPDDEAKYQDSQFTPEYYDRAYFNDKDEILIHYISGGVNEKDRIEITDTGVGLGGARLQGYFEMGYSTKRLSKMPLGKWGIGAKSPLSVGVDYYTLESTYNGQRYRFNIYAQSFDSIIPRFNIESGEENPFVVFGEDYKVYYEPTIEKNGVKITIGAKKAHKKQYIDAVKSQLLYFDYIRFIVTHDDGNVETINYKANILYEDEYIILSDNLYYTKPHLLLNKVNYGYINWEELELQDRNGNIGIKVAPEDIEVTPSREGVIWSEKTKEMVNRRFEDVQGIASRAIQKELTETDFWRWIQICFSIGQRYAHNGIDIVSRLAKIIDINEIKPAYNPMPEIKFTQAGILSGLNIRHVFMENEQRQNKFRNVVKRKNLKTIGAHINYPVFYMPGDVSASNRKDKYLLKMYPAGFIVIREPLTTEKMKESGAYSDDEIEQVRLARTSRDGEGVPPETLYELLIESKEVTDYMSVEIPEDFRATESEEEEKEEATESEEDKVVTKTAAVTAAERRKVEGKIVMYTPRIAGTPQITMVKDSQGNSVEEKRLFISQKLEQKISDINDWDSEEIYYGTEADDEVIHFVAALTRATHPANNMVSGARRNHTALYTTPVMYDLTTKTYVKDTKRLGWNDMKWFRKNYFNMQQQMDQVTVKFAYYCQHFYDNKHIKLVKVSQANVKYVRDFKHIQEFFISIRNKKISMSNTLIKWNTARLIRESLHKASFLYNFSSFNEQYANKYATLVDYVNRHYREVKDPAGSNYYGINTDTYNDLIRHLDSVHQFQEVVRLNPEDKETIADIAEKLFGNRELQDGMAVEPEIMEMMEDVIAYTQATGDMFNFLPILTGYNDYQTYYNNGTQRSIRHKIPEHLEHEIKLYLEYKEVLDYGISEAGTDTIAVNQPEEQLPFDRKSDEEDTVAGEGVFAGGIDEQSQAGI